MGLNWSAAYFVAWQQDSSHPLDALPWGTFTELMDFSLVTSPNRDGTLEWTHGMTPARSTEIVTACHDHGVKCILSIGGSDDQNWDAACSPANRTTFINNIVATVQQYGYDGVDLDVEQDFGFPDHADYIATVAQLRTALNQLPSHPLLTVASDPSWQAYMTAPVAPYVDQINLMSYNDTVSNAANDLSAYTSRGVPASKLALGVGMDPGMSDANNPADAGAKAAYVVNNGYGGVMEWLMTDEAPNYPDMQAIGAYLTSSPPPPPTVLSVAATGVGITNGTGVVHQDAVVTLTVNMSEPTTVSGGTPSLTLNDGGTATYQGGSGSSALAFSYSVAAGQNTSDLTVTAFNANGATITDSVGNPANMAGAVTNPPGTLQVDTTTNSDSDSDPEIPILTIGSSALTLPAQGSVALPISVTAIDSDDTISVTISGLTKYERVTDNLDGITFRPRHGSVTLTAAEVNSGLTLMSTYRGSDQPVNTLTVTATNSTAGEEGTSAAQTITVTDPPANSIGRVDDEGATAFANAAAALIAQFGAAGFQAGADRGGPIGAPPQAHLMEDTSSLTKPHT